MADEEANLDTNDNVFEEPKPATSPELEQQSNQEKLPEQPETSEYKEPTQTEPEPETHHPEPETSNSPEPTRKEPPVPAQRQFRPTSARSINFSTNKLSRTRSSSDFFHANPHLVSVNDFKYVGDQFKVGKPDPNKKLPHEVRFQKMWQPKIVKLTSTSTTNLSFTPRKDTDVVKEYRITKDDRLLTNLFNLNDFKYTGNQFKVGKLDPKLQSPVEKRFQQAYKNRLMKLSPNWDEIKQIKRLNLHDLKEIHNQLLVK